ncbi:MAG: hypothetical protein K8I30_18655, partial [Anaerolineae bacterium]|nr:hypothetical protein [Anaerolineae bacterium]
MDVSRVLAVPLYRTADWVVNLAWSPNAEHIAFITDENGYYRLYTLDMDGSARRLTDQTASSRSPEWSPDSQSISFESQQFTQSMVYVVSADGQRIRDLMGSGSNADLQWSPDGTQAVLSSWIGGNTTYEIYLMDAEACIDGTALCSPRRLTTNSANDWRPSWSPNGEQVVFLSDRSSAWEIYAIDADCEACEDEARRLTDMGVAGFTTLSWSPDSRWLAFVVAPIDRGSMIYMLDMDCAALLTDESCLHRIAVNAHSPEWSPDGQSIVYYRSEGEDSSIGLLDTVCIETGCQGYERRLTPPGLRVWYPVWRPYAKERAQ